MADRAKQPQPSTAWERTTRPTAVWTGLVRGAATDEERACMAAATAQADRVWVALHTPRLLKLAAPTGGADGRGGRGVPPRNADWHRLALSAYEVLRASGAYGHLAHLRPLTCVAVEPVLREWLASPAPPDHTHAEGQSQGQRESQTVTVAQRLGIGDAVHYINGDTLAAHLSTVLSAAQDAAVFGVPRHRVELVTAPTSEHGGTVVRVVVDTPHGVALASPPMALGVLIDPDAAGVPATTAALRRVAAVASELFIRHARSVWQHPPPMPTDDRSTTPTARAFPKLRLGQRAAPPVPPTPAPGPGPTIAHRPSDDPHPGRPR